MSYLDSLTEAQKKDLYEARAYLERAEAEKRDLSVEERTAWDALNEQIDARQDHINSVRAAEQRDARVADAMASAPEVRTEARQAQAEITDGDIIRQLALGERRSHMFNMDLRAMATNEATKGKTTVPVGFIPTIIENLIYTGPMLDGAFFQRYDTASGEELKIPTELTRPAGTATAEGATLAVSDPTFGDKSLKAFKFSTLILASKELVADAGFPLEQFLGRQLGVALGTAVNNALTLGTGAPNQATGIVTTLGTVPGETGGTGVAGAFTADNLITLMHAVNSVYANRPTAAWMVNRSTLGAIRRLKGAEGYLFQPAATVGSPNTLLGYPIVENPDIANVGTDAKSVLFGDMSQYLVRVVNGLEVTRSDEAYFTSDQIAWKATIRVDGNGAADVNGGIKYFAGGTA
jgi:HK97 family phage major capsid protein